MKEKKPFNGVWVFLGLVAVSIGIYLSAHNGRDEQEKGRGPIFTSVGEGVMVAQSRPEDNQMDGQTAQVERERQKPNVTRRLPARPQNIRLVLTTTGRGENANWGVCGMTTFVLTYCFDCDVVIKSKSETATGMIKVEEERTFNIARETLDLSNADVKLALYETLPLEETFKAVKVVGTVVACAYGEPTTAIEICDKVDKVDEVAKKLDGKSVRGLLSPFGFDASQQVKEKFDKFIGSRVMDVMRSNNLEGKTYLVTYYQDKDSGAPMHVNFKNKDGSKLRTKEEWEILRQANAFMNSDLIADESMSPGDHCTVDASRVGFMLDPYVEGVYSGQVTVDRRSDDADGNWRLGVRPARLTLRSDRGRTNGEVCIENGEAMVDAKKLLVRAMTLTGTCAMKNLSTHHLLCNSRFEGNCGFRAVLVTQDKE